MPTQFCPSCGARLAEPKRYCFECGAPLPALAPPATHQRGEGRIIWIILGAISGLGVLMLLACAGLLLLTVRNSAAAAAARPPISPAAAEASPTSAPAPTVDAARSVLLYDDFSDPRESALSSEEDDISRLAFEDGAYLIEVKDSDMLSWALTDHSYDDLAIEVDAAVAPESPVVAAGLIFHYQDTKNFYLFSISSDGYYALELLKDDEWRTLIDWTVSDAIDAEHNTLRVETKGDRITLMVNGELLEATQDDSLAEGGAGLAVSSFEARQVAIRFDNLLITRSP